MDTLNKLFSRNERGNYKTPLVQKVIDGSFGTSTFGQKIKDHLSEKVHGKDPEYRKKRFEQKLGVSYKKFISELQNGEFEISGVFQENTINHEGDLVVIIKRTNTTNYSNQNVVMVFNHKNSSTLFPPEVSLVNYLEQKIIEGNFNECNHYLDNGLNSEYISLLNRHGQRTPENLKLLNDVTIDGVGNKMKGIVIDIAQMLKPNGNAQN